MAINPPTVMYIPGHIVPKQRPKITRNGTYYTASYKHCLSTIQKYVKEQRPTYPAVKGLKLEVTFYGSVGEYGRSDLDNLVGSVMDALVNSGWLPNDTTLWINHLVSKFEPSKETITKVVITPPETE